MRLWYGVQFALYVFREVVSGSWRVTRWAWGGSAQREATPPPAIVEFPMAARSDLEISLLASCITITPGTMVVGLASAQGEVPATLFVHAAFGGSRDSIVAGLAELERRLLRASRPRGQRAGEVRR